MNSRYELNKNLAQMLKGGVIMDVTTPSKRDRWGQRLRSDNWARTGTSGPPAAWRG